jgi:hypothetical protein
MVQEVVISYKENWWRKKIVYKRNSSLSLCIFGERTREEENVYTKFDLADSPTRSTLHVLSKALFRRALLPRSHDLVPKGLFFELVFPFFKLTPVRGLKSEYKRKRKKRVRQHHIN